MSVGGQRSGLFLLPILLFLAGCSNTPVPAPIYLGHVATLSGTDKMAGEQASLGIRLALDELNKETGKRPVQVRHTDTQGKLEAFEAEAVRLVALNRVVGLLGGTTPQE